MDEPGRAATAPNQPISYSLRQIIAVMTAVGAGFALFFVLVSPPLGSSGLSWAMLPAGLLAAAIWFCSIDTSTRLAMYAVVASLISLAFGAIAFSKTDWLFGHGLGMPQLSVASFVTSLIGALTGGVWIMSRFAARQQASAFDSVADGVKSPPVRWRGAAAVVPLTLVSCLAVLGGLPSLPRAMQRLDLYIQQRKIEGEARQQSMERYRAALKETHPEIPGIIAKKVTLLKSEDVATRRQEASNIRAIIRNVRGESPLAQIFDNPATKAALMSELDNNDPEVRRHVAMAIVYLRDQAERSERLKAIAALGIPQDSATVTEGKVTLMRMLEWENDEQLRCEAIRAVGRMGPAASAAAPQLGVIVLKGPPAERAAAAEALAAMGPGARQFLPNHAAPPP